MSRVVWAPRFSTMANKERTRTVKNQHKLRALIAEYRTDAEAIEAIGGKARFEREEIQMYEAILIKHGCPL